MFIVKDRGLLKFVFTRPPNVVGHYITKFKEEVEKSLGIPQVSLNLYDTQFYSKNDGSLDFSSTGSCFQLVGPNNYNPKDTISLLEDPSNHELKNVYKQYEVKNIEVRNIIFFPETKIIIYSYFCLAMFPETSQISCYLGTDISVRYCNFHWIRIDFFNMPFMLFL